MSIILQANSVSKYFTSEPVLDRVSFDIRTGEHVALIGPNGAGKTTLLKILMQELDPDRGEVALTKNATLGVLRQRHDLPEQQTVLESAREAMAAVSQLVDRANEIASQMSAASAQDRDTLARRYDDLQTEINQRDGYQIENKIDRVLSGLGFPKSEHNKDVNKLSGGQLNRLMLARLLLEEPTLMLLDEPSNHLDIESTEWLEDFLKQSKQAFLLVSHDRYFLDRVSNQTLELVNAKIDKYPGNYSKYRVLKEQRLEVEQKTYEKQQIEIEKLKDFIRRNHHGLKHAQAEDRRKKLERIELVELPREIHSAPMKFAPATRTGDIVMRCTDLAKSFGDEKLFDNVDFQIERGQRWGILGANGCGKSTLLRCLLQQETPDCGQVKIGEGVKVGYFDQNLDSIDDDEIAADAIRPDHKQMVDQERRDLLAKFGIDGDMALQKVNSFSGGERNRVALAFLAAQDANFLILDEPTNHLDLWARHSLETALKKFDGTVLMVSHDRYFINELCDHLLVFEPNRVFAFDGSYTEYRHMAEKNRKEEAAALQPFKAEKKKREREEKSNIKRKRQFPYRKVDDIEAEIKNHEQRIEELHFELANPEVLRNEHQIKSVKSELADVNDKLQSLYAHWEEAIELN